MKYFVVSDIHGDYFELKQALWDAGFRKTNKEHTLIVCGDVFDRFNNPIDVYKFLMSINKNRLILIKGNHEYLYEELLVKEFPDSYDFSNHTVDTFCYIAGYNPEVLTASYWYRLKEEDTYDRIMQTWNEIVDKVINHPITNWIKSDVWKNYYEVDKYIFVHSFIPVTNEDGLPSYYISNRHFSQMINWRTEATDSDWYDATWGCPWKQYINGLFNNEENNGKVLVCGHWHTTDFRENLDCDFSEDTNIYFSNHLIGLDCGVWHKRGQLGYYHPLNVLVIDGDTCYDRYGRKLVYYKAEPHHIIETVTEEK